MSDGRVLQRHVLYLGQLNASQEQAWRKSVEVLDERGEASQSLNRVATCIAWRYTERVIRTFRHKGLEAFFRTGSKAGIQSSQAPRLRRQLAKLNTSAHPQDMDIPGWRLHPLAGELTGHWSVWVNGNWRLTFAFEGEDAVLVDYRDYHQRTEGT